MSGLGSPWLWLAGNGGPDDFLLVLGSRYKGATTMPLRDGTTIRPRVLLVSDDDHYSAGLKPHLAGIDVLSLPEARSGWRSGLALT